MMMPQLPAYPIKPRPPGECPLCLERIGVKRVKYTSIAICRECAMDRPEDIIMSDEFEDQ